MRDRTIAAALFAAVAMAALAAPVVQITDHKYLLMASDSLVTRGTLSLDGLVLEHERLTPGPGAVSPVYQIALVAGHFRHVFPLGGAVLAAPFVALGRALGVATVDATGHYDGRGEETLNRWIAACLAALLAVAMYGTGRLLLPPGASAAASLLVVLGSQVASTTSRGLWSHGWAILPLAATLWLIARTRIAGRRSHPLACAALLAAATICRPTLALSAVAIVAWLASRPGRRREAAWMAAGGCACALVFVAWSWATAQRALPTYYGGGRLALAALPLGLAGNLASPSRSTLLFVPWLPWVAWLALRRRRSLAAPDLAALAATVTVAHLLVVSSFPHWYGGHCYGARLTADLVPWWHLALVLALGTLCGPRRAEEPVARTRRTLASGAALFAIAVVLNGVGAASERSWTWNAEPVSIDARPARLWSWRDAQFLAPLREDARP